MKYTFTNIGNQDVGLVCLGTENDADPISISVRRGSSHSVHLTEGQEKNLKTLIGEKPDFFRDQMKVTTP